MSGGILDDDPEVGQQGAIFGRQVIQPDLRNHKIALYWVRSQDQQQG